MSFPATNLLNFSVTSSRGFHVNSDKTRENSSSNGLSSPIIRTIVNYISQSLDLPVENTVFCESTAVQVTNFSPSPAIAL